MHPRETPVWVFMPWRFRCSPERNTEKPPMAFLRPMTMMGRQGDRTDAA